MSSLQNSFVFTRFRCSMLFRHQCQIDRGPSDTALM